MQELIDKVEHAISYNVEGGLVEKYTWAELFNDMDALLEMEKEQTEAAYHDGVDDARNNSIKYGYYKDKKKNIHIERSPEWP